MITTGIPMYDIIIGVSVALVICAGALLQDSARVQVKKRDK